MQQARSRPAEADLYGPGHVGGGDPVQRSFIDVHGQVVLRLRILDVPVDVNDARVNCGRFA